MAGGSLSNWARLCSAPRVIASRAFVVLVLLASPAAAGQRVSIELVLAVDVSLSVNDIEYALQMKGMAAAFRDKDVIDLIRQHKYGVAVTMTQWSGTYDADQPIPWHRLTDEASALALADMISVVPRRAMSNYTGLGHAIAFASDLIDSNEFVGDERKIDVSGDGRNNTGPEPSQMREAAAARDITINGLAITNNDPGLAGYYSANVIGGPAAFVIQATDFEAFAEAFRRKLKRELSPKIALFAAGTGHQ
ncbi:MAG: DUF1194 domain-containing protein [Hyphomicrobiales bacterium]